MGTLAQAHRAGQARPALERVQGTHAGGSRLPWPGLAHPARQGLAQLGQQLLGLLGKHREELGLGIVHHQLGWCARRRANRSHLRPVVDQALHLIGVSRLVEARSKEVQQPLQVLHARRQQGRLVLDVELDGAHLRQRLGQGIAHPGELTLPDPLGTRREHLGQFDAARIRRPGPRDAPFAQPHGEFAHRLVGIVEEAVERTDLQRQRAHDLQRLGRRPRSGLDQPGEGLEGARAEFLHHRHRQRIGVFLVVPAAFRVVAQGLRRRGVVDRHRPGDRLRQHGQFGHLRQRHEGRGSGRLGLQQQLQHRQARGVHRLAGGLGENGWLTGFGGFRGFDGFGDFGDFGCFDPLDRLDRLQGGQGLGDLHGLHRFLGPGCRGHLSCRRRRRQFDGRKLVGGTGEQFAPFGVEAQQHARDFGLHRKDVEQHPERAQVGGHRFEQRLRARRVGSHFATLQPGSPAGQRAHTCSSVVEPPHREHALDRPQPGLRSLQQVDLCRLAHELVQLLLDLCQRQAQLLRHGQRRATVGHRPVDLAHPGLGRLVHGPGLPGTLQARHDGRHALRPGGMVDVGSLQRGLQHQQQRGHLHRHGRRWWAVRFHRLTSRRRQRGGQGRACGQQPLKRIAHQRELLGQRRQVMQLPGAHGGPHITRGTDAPARLRDPHRVEPAQARVLVILDRLVAEPEGRTRSFQARHRPARARRLGLGAKEEQVARELLLHRRGRLARARQRQQPGCDALGVDVGPQGTGRLGLEEGSSQFPQRRSVSQRARTQAGAELAQPRQRLPVGLSHQREHQRLELAARAAVHLCRHHTGLLGQLGPSPGRRPEVGRMDTLGTRQFLQRPVLREQGQRGHALARQHMGQEVEHGKRAPLDAAHRFRGHERAIGDEAHHHRLGGGHHARRGGLAHQFERARNLVQCLACRAQDRGVDDVAFGAVQALPKVAAQRLVPLLQRQAQLLAHPRQRAQVGATVGPVGGCRGF